MAYHLTKNRPKKHTLAATIDIALVVMLAEQKGFFYDEKAYLTIKTVPYARKGLELLLEEKVDSAILVETNVAYLGYMQKSKPIKCYASLEKRTGDCILLRQENKELSAPSQLKGKTIGFMPRTSSHTFLNYFLKTHEINKKDIKLKPISPQALGNALIRGEVDAISVWHPYSHNTMFAMNELGIRYTHFKNPGYTSEVVLATHKATAIKDKISVTRILRALKKAENYLKENPQEAARILRQKMNLGENVKDEILSLYTPEISPIDNNYIKTVEMLAEWISQNDTEFRSSPIPDYKDLIDNELFLDIITEKN